MGKPRCDNPEQSNAPVYPRPDFRQAFVQTLLAGAFFMVGATLRGTAGISSSTGLWFGLASALGALVIYSWYLSFRRWPTWAVQPEGLRSALARQASLDSMRAMNHGLMALLSISLCSFCLLGLSIIPDGQETLVDWFVFVLSLADITFASAVAARVARDFVRQRRARHR